MLGCRECELRECIWEVVSHVLHREDPVSSAQPVVSRVVPGKQVLKKCL